MTFRKKQKLHRSPDEKRATCNFCFSQKFIHETAKTGHGASLIDREATSSFGKLQVRSSTWRSMRFHLRAITYSVIYFTLSQIIANCKMLDANSSLVRIVNFLHQNQAWSVSTMKIDIFHLPSTLKTAEISLRSYRSSLRSIKSLD